MRKIITKEDEARSLEQRLENYKKMQAKVAMSKGEDIYKDLMSCKTLTQARIAVYGRKEKVNKAYRGHDDLELNRKVSRGKNGGYKKKGKTTEE